MTGRGEEGRIGGVRGGGERLKGQDLKEYVNRDDQSNRGNESLM